MPKIDVIKKDIESLLAKKITKDEFETLLSSAKAELGELEDGVYRIELNDTNRPDLWTTAGLARQINQYLKLKKYNYPFFDNKKECNLEIIVDKQLKNIRPYIVGFGAKNIEITNDVLLELIQNQEKLCNNFGKNREDVAIGIYKFDRIKFPVHYKAIKPDGIKFVPLGFEDKMDLNEIIKKHPKGIEFGHIVKDFDLYPIIVDNTDNVLSFPPIINSRYIGEVEVGDKNIFIEITGTDLHNIILVANLLACDLYDRGAEIVPVKIKYPYNTSFSNEITIPFKFENRAEISLSDFERIVGEKPNNEEIIDCLGKMGYKNVKVVNDKVKCDIPDYRNDIMHPVDIIEDFVIGKSYDNFKPEMPSDFTIGGLSDIELLSDKVNEIMVGAGFQEIMSNILNSSDNIYYKMNKEVGKSVEIANPMTESYNVLRDSLIPSLLEVESKSAKAEYPHKLFEIGEVLVKSPDENYGAITLTNLGILISHPKANFTEMRTYIYTLFYYLRTDNYKIIDKDITFLIQGRTGDIIIDGKSVGYIGEVHPESLQRWDINMPTTVAEINLLNFINSY